MCYRSLAFSSLLLLTFYDCSASPGITGTLFPLFSNHGTWARRTHWKPSPAFFFFLFTPIWSRKKQKKKKHSHRNRKEKQLCVGRWKLIEPKLWAAKVSNRFHAGRPRSFLFSYYYYYFFFFILSFECVFVCINSSLWCPTGPDHLTLPRKSPLFSFTPYRRPTGWREVTTQKGRIKKLKGSRWTFCVWWELIAVDRRNQFGFGWIFRIEIQWVNRVRCQMLTILIRVY